MPAFAYAAPDSVAEAARLLAAEKGVAKLLSGGTDLLVQLRSGRIACDLVVDTKKIPGISGVRGTADGGFVIGAATAGAALGEHAALRAAWPGVVEAANLIGSTQVQGRATLAGNLCNASPAADSVPAMIAARAVAVVAGPNGKRDVPVEQVVTGPGRTALARDEFILELRLPPRPARAGDAYLRLIPRTEMDIAVVGCGVNLSLAPDGSIADARVCLGAVAPTPVLVDAAAILNGQRLSDGVLEKLATAAEAVCKPIDDKRGTVEYRTKIAGVLARRAASIAYARAEKAR